MALVAKRGGKSRGDFQSSKQPTWHPVLLQPVSTSDVLRDLVGQVGHLGSHRAAPVACLLTKTAGPVDVADESIQWGWVSRNESPEQDTEEHVLAEAVRFAGQVDKVWRPDWSAVGGDTGRDVPSRFAQASKGQEGVEQYTVSLTAGLLTGFGRKAQPGITPGPGLLL